MPLRGSTDADQGRGRGPGPHSTQRALRGESEAHSQLIRRLKQENGKFKASLENSARSCLNYRVKIKTK